MSFSFLKKVAALLIVLGVLWAVYMYQQVPHPLAPYAKAMEQAQIIRIERTAGKVKFAKRAEGWVVELSQGSDAPVDDLPWDSLLSSLKQFVVEDEISDRADRASEFEVDSASGTRVVVEDKHGKVLADGVFGKPASDYIHIFFKPWAENSISMGRGLYPSELGSSDPYAWRRKDLINIPEAEIKRVRIKVKTKETHLVRLSTASWTSNGTPIAESDIYPLLGKLSHLRADGFADPAKFPGLTFESLNYASLMIEGEKTSCELRIGPLDIKALRYPLSTGPANGIAWLSQATVDSLLKF